MISTIEEALYPLRLTAFIVGYGIYRNRLNRSKTRLSILYMFTLWIIYACLFNYVLIFFTPKRVFPHFIEGFMIMINLFVTFTSVIIIIRDYKKFEICLKKLNLVDDTLEKLGIPKEYCKIYNSIRWILFIWLVTICATYTVDSLWCVEFFNDMATIIIPLVMSYPLHVNTLMDIMFAFILRHLHSELCRVAHDINDMFGIQITLQMMSYFIVLTGLIYIQYCMLLYAKQMHYLDVLEMMVLNNMWSFIFLTKFILMNYICESISSKAQKTKSVILRLTNLARFAEAREEICQFVLQVSLRPLKINGIGLFHFGYNFIYKFFVQILTFIIIMAQMNISTIPEIILDKTRGK